MSIDGRLYDVNSGVRKVIITSNPILHPFSNSQTAPDNYYCYSRDMKGFQIQIDLQAMPAGVTIDQIKPNQVWWVEKRTSLYRIYLYAGTWDPVTNQINTTDPLPPSTTTVYYMNAYSTVTQTGNTNSVQPMYLNVAQGFGFYVIPSGVTPYIQGNYVLTSGGNPVTNDSVNGSRIYAQYAGVYNIQFSAQIQSSNNSAVSANIWLRQNGVDVPWSAGEISIAGAGYTLPSWNYIANMNVLDYVELMWSAGGSQVSIAAVSGFSVGPASPSIAVTVTQA